jgi:hypothetical protein
VPTNFAKCTCRKIKTVGTARKRGAFAHPCISAKKLSLWKPKSAGQSESVLTIFAFGMNWWAGRAKCAYAHPTIFAP